jgi:hypothetical protein
MAFSETAASKALYSGGMQIPIKELLRPGTAPNLFTVRGRVLKIDVGTLSAVGTGGLTHIVPVITNFNVQEETDVPLDGSGLSRYIPEVLIPNTIAKTGKHITRGILNYLFGKDGSKDFIEDVTDPFFETFTRFPIMGGAGMTVEQLEDYTGIQKNRMGIQPIPGHQPPAGATPTGSAYPAVKIQEMTREQGRKYGRAIGLGEGFSGYRAHVDETLKRHFGEDYETVIKNDEFMAGVMFGIKEGYEQRKKKGKYMGTRLNLADDTVKPQAHLQ